MAPAKGKGKGKSSGTGGPSAGPSKLQDVLTLGVGSDEELEEGSNIQGKPGPLNWREAMREEIQIAVRDAMKSASMATAAAIGNPTTIDPSDVITSSELSTVVKKIEASNRSNKFAIRLAGISKEGNRQQFLEMVDLREILEKAEAALKGDDMGGDDIFAARDALGEAILQVDSRMSMIERIDAHPLSWPVATEFQKMKRARPADQEDEKLFQEAEKKVAAKKRKRDVSTSRGPSAKPNDRFHFSRGNGKCL